MARRDAEGTGGMSSARDRLDGRAGKGMARFGRDRWREMDFVGDANGSSMVAICQLRVSYVLHKQSWRRVHGNLTH